MGQQLSRLQEGHAALARPYYSTAYDSPMSDDDAPSCAQYENIPTIDGIPAASIPVDSLFKPDRCPLMGDSEDLSKATKEPTSETYKAKEIPITSPSSSFSPTYEPTASALAEARRQYVTGRGLFWSLAVLKLSPHFLHPVDLTATEFLTFVTTADADSWLLTHRPRLLHRVISRRVDAQHALTLAEIPHRQLRGIEMFELMDRDGRDAFIAEYQRRMKSMLENVHDAVSTDIVPPEVSSVVRLKMKDATSVEEMYIPAGYNKKNENQSLDGFNGEDSMPRYSSNDASVDRTLRKRSILFESLGDMFNRHPPTHANGSKPYCGDSLNPSSSPTKSATCGPEPPKFSVMLRDSMQSLRHLFERKGRAFKRPGIGEHVFV